MADVKDALRKQVEEKLKNEKEYARLEAELRAEMQKADSEEKKKALEAKAKADSEAKAKFKADAIKRINAASDKYWESEITGTIVPFKEKSGNVAPAIVIGDLREKKDSKDVAIVRVLVFSPATATPYQADYEI